MTILLVDSDKRALDREAQRLSRRQSGIVVVLHSSAADAEKFAMHHDVVLAPGDRDHILSGVFNQFLSALTEPVE